jgi:hypothetical protein
MAKLPTKYRRTGLMTAEELDKRYKPNKALALSIEKWTRAGYIKNWEELCEDVGGYLSDETCGLCRKDAETGASCNGCILNNPKDMYSMCCKPFAAADRAARCKDRPSFMKARKNLLARMRRAYDRGER